MQFKRAQGFTFIELITVVAIIAVLAVIAVPRYINLTTTSYQNSITTLAAALASASAENFARRSANSASGSTVDNCNDIGALLPSGALPAGYTITAGAITAGSSTTCTVTGPTGLTATFRGLGIA